MSWKRNLKVFLSGCKCLDLTTQGNNIKRFSLYLLNKYLTLLFIVHINAQTRHQQI